MDTDKKLKESKGKWERDRRKRLNDAFEKLNKVLPSYDPSVNLAKIDIIEQATTAIQDLSDRLKKALSSEEKENTKGDVFIKFELRLKKLLLRNEFLSNLLKDAGIKVPDGYGTVKKKLPKWSNKISPEQAKVLQEQALEKENTNKQSKSPKRKKPSNTSVKLRRKQLKTSIEKKKRRRNASHSPKCLIIFSKAAPLSNPVYVVTKSDRDKVEVASTTKTPIVSANIQSSLFSDNPALSSLGPGTLIFANGSVVPINQFQPTLIANPITNHGNSTLIIVSKADSASICTKIVSIDTKKSFVPKLPIVTKLNSSNYCSSWPRIRPKWCSTSTTQVNKVPIPALTSKYNNYVYVSNGKPKDVPKSRENKNKESIKSSNFAKRKCDDQISQISKKSKIQASTGNIEEPSENNVVKVAEPVPLSEESTTKTTKLQNEIPVTENNDSVKPQTVNSSVEDQVIEKAKDSCANIVQSKSLDLEAPKSPETSTYTPCTNVDTIALKAKSDVSTDLSKKNSEIDSAPKQNLDLNLTHSDLSTDIFASLQVPPGCQNPGSTSPTAAFLLAFPLVSSGVKITEVIDGENNSGSQRETPNLLQIGNMEETKPTQAQPESHSESLTPSLLTLENFSFFTQKDVCSSFYTSTTTVVSSTMSNIFSNTNKTTPLFDDLFYNQAISSLTSYNPPTSSSKLSSVLPGEVTNETNPFLASHSVPSTNVSVSNDITNKKVDTDSKSMNKSVDFSFYNNLYTDIPLTYSLNNTTTSGLSIYTSRTSHAVSESTTFPISVYGSTNNPQQFANAPIKSDLSKDKSPVPILDKGSNKNDFGYYLPYTQSNVNFDSLKSKTTISQNKSADPKSESVKKSDCNKITSNSTPQGNICDLNNYENKKYFEHNMQKRGMDTKPKEQFPSHFTSSWVNDSNSKAVSFNTEQTSANQNIFERHTDRQKQQKVPLSANNNKPANQCKVDINMEPTLNIHGLPSINEIISGHGVNRFQENNANRNLCPFPSDKSNSAQQSQNISNFKYYPLPLPVTTSSSTRTKAALSNNFQFKFPQSSASTVKPKDNAMNNQNFGGDNFGYTTYSSDAKKQNDSNLYSQSDFSNNSKNKNTNQIFGSENFSFNRSYPDKKNEQGHKQVFANKVHEYSNYSNKNVPCTHSPVVSNFNPCYTNAGNYYYDYHTENNYGNSYLKNSSNHGNSSYYFDYNACSENAKQNRLNSTSLDPYNRDKFASVITTKSESSNQQNKPVNWMTTPNSNVRPKYYPLTPFSKENDNALYNSSGYFNTSSTMNIKPNDNAVFRKKQEEENQFSWSPSKVPSFLDASHSFVSATLPTLVGDLALNTQPSEHKPSKEKNTKENVRKTGVNYDVLNNHPNFLSVSQLVENKDPTPAKVTSRRNSGSRAKNTSPQKNKRNPKHEQNKEVQNYQKVEKNNAKNSSDQSMKSYNNKNMTSNYSAEALIGHSVQSDSKRNKAVVPSFFTDNLVTYFPPIDSQITQESNYIQQQQNYSFVNSSIMSNPSTTYLPQSSFLNDSVNQEFCLDGLNMYNPNVPNKDKGYNKEGSKANVKPEKNSCKKPKKRNTNDGILPSFDIPFLSIPGAINSPILPDDFHHTFLPPTTPYPCKNPLYPKQNAELAALLPPLPPVPGSKSVIQHPDVSPSINSAGGTSLTNFNLSTIFPEINKGSSAVVYSAENKFKDQTVSQNYIASSSANFGKPTFTFSSYNNA